jgi:hypothetical protein
MYVSTHDALIDAAIEDLQARLELTDEGQFSDYFGVNISIDDNGDFHSTQPHLIDQILKEINFRVDTKLQATSASVSILKRDKDLNNHKAYWDYRRMIGKLDFLYKCTRPKLACSVHQAAQFSANPKISHTEAIH